MLLWTGLPAKPAEEIHMVVKNLEASTVVSFRNENELELARLSGPNVPEVLEWLIAAITEPFTRITRSPK